jgi:hypothetical protein
MVRRPGLWRSFADTLAAARPGADQDESAHQFGSIERHLQNRHRLADGWQGSTVRAILENPRHTGYTVFGRWTKQEVLLNPDVVPLPAALECRVGDHREPARRLA